MSIETNQYIVTNTTDVEKLTRSILQAEDTASGNYGVYLKSLVGTIQAELGSPPRFRNSKAAKISEDETTAHLKALEAVHGRFYEAVSKAATELYTNTDERRSKTRKFVSAASTVRGFIRAGNDVRTLAAHKVTKAALATPRAKRKFSVESLKARAASLSDQLVSVAKNLTAANSTIARETLGTVLAQLAQAAGMTEHMARDSAKAVETGTAFHDKTGVFVPINLEAVREARRVAA